ncbi:MAG TPA: sugar phosphate isomerase/epimerase family protein [Solirubrobacterales bacterium]|nr:sugar phosphate isomerase/epimerase family protein [Solirubrobacterales bacterium]
MTELGLYFAVCHALDLDDALEWVVGLGIETIEVSSHVGGRFDVEETLHDDRIAELSGALERHEVRISAINMSLDGQLLLGPHNADTDRAHPGSPAEKREFAARRLTLAADLAARLQVPVVSGFVGCEDYSRWFPWPDPQAWEAMEPAFVESVTPILDHFQEVGVRFGMEPHPRQLVYNTETALRSLQLLDNHPAWGFTLDPANLVLAGVDPVVFAAELGDRVINVHAKDAEIVKHNVARSGLLANGPWSRPDRGFRFRVAGWGDVPWKRLLTELSVGGYRGSLTIEHEDPTMGAREGVCKAVEFIEPLLIREDPEATWW